MLLVAGMTGAVFAGYPLHQATILFGWRNVTLASALLALLMAVLVFMFVRDDPSEKGLKSYLDKESSGQKEEKSSKASAGFSDSVTPGFSPSLQAESSEPS